ncbi:MAG: hypothetical protein LBU22_06560 [Dysgonamonadaceae bacterium]|jgi:hypothetical protein|nr:hypothetical protein [Dysgonamonadaceae bacterium]
MCKNKIIFFAIILTIIPGFVQAQNSTNSPYTRYGYGNLSDKATATQRGMGGIGYGLRNSQIINTSNSASFSNIDSMTFMFDMGVMGQMAWFKDGVNKEKKMNGNLEYLSMQFPLLKGMGVGVGLEPVSFVGYSYMDTTRLPGDNALANYVFQGNGGMSQVYGAFAYDFLGKLSLGVKFAYLFGDIVHNNITPLSQTQIGNAYNMNYIDTLNTRGLTYEFGLQYHQTIGKYKTLTVGGIFSPKIRLGGRVSEMFVRTDASGAAMDAPEYRTTRDSVFELPMTIGLGFSYNDLNKITLGADVLFQNWADAKFYDQTNAFYNRLKINAGGELIPSFTSNNFFNRVRYRAGAYYTNSYLKVNDVAGNEAGYKEYGVSVGLGLPMTNKKSYVNMALEYSLIRPNISTLINEQYFKITLSYTFNETWFLRRKIQ